MVLREDSGSTVDRKKIFRVRTSLKKSETAFFIPPRSQGLCIWAASFSGFIKKKCVHPTGQISQYSFPVSLEGKQTNWRERKKVNIFSVNNNPVRARSGECKKFMLSPADRTLGFHWRLDVSHQSECKWISVLVYLPHNTWLNIYVLSEWIDVLRKSLENFTAWLSPVPGV